MSSSGVRIVMPPAVYRVEIECVSCRASTTTRTEDHNLVSRLGHSPACSFCGSANVRVTIDSGAPQWLPQISALGYSSFSPSPSSTPPTVSTRSGIVVGFRYWTTRDYDLKPMGMCHAGAWVAGPNYATCVKPGVLPLLAHVAPHVDCECGLYLRPAPTPTDAAYTDRPSVLGAALAWGRTLWHGDLGIRAEWARPILLLVDPAWPRARKAMVCALADEYDCRVVYGEYPKGTAHVERLLDAAREYGTPLCDVKIRSRGATKP